MPSNSLMTGVEVKSLDADAVVGPSAGTSFAVPKRTGQNGRNIVMAVVPSVVPAALTVDIEGSEDKVTWFSTGTMTTPAGGAVTVPEFNFNWVRANKKAQTGAAAVTATLKMS